MPNTTDASLPNYTRPEVISIAPDLDMVHDVLAGTRRMHAQSAAVPYIRKWKDEDQGVYDIRRKIETVFEGLGRTLSAAIGMLFAKPPRMEWNNSETAMVEHWENIDGAGTAGHVFVKRFAESAMADGIAVLLVDHTSPPEGVVVTDKNAMQLGLRPQWASYPRSAVISWRTGVINNKKTLTQLVLHECSDVDDGVFGSKTVHRFRALRLVDGQATWTLFEQRKDNASKVDDFIVAGSGIFRNKTGEIASFLPVSVAYTGRTDAAMCATIPLLGVAWANLAHWRASTNLTFYRELCAFPQPVVVGDIAQELGQNGQSVPGKLRIGPMVVVHLANEGSFEWKELSGTSMDQLEKGVNEKLKQMSQLGVSFLATDTRAAETAEAKRLDATAENSTLATAAQGIEDAVNGALEIHAWYMGIAKADAPVIALSRDYESTTMEPGVMTAYVQAVASAGLPPRLLLEAWQAGGRIGPDVDLEALEMEMMANSAAIDAQKQLSSPNEQTDAALAA